MKALDYPPVWLALFVAITWGVARVFPHTVFLLPFRGWIALVLLLAGLGLMGLAVWEMIRAKTTIVPRQNPNALVTSGIFKRTRNPIYLGDLLVLTAGVIWWGSISAILLLWIFPQLINRRFILDEENKMHAYFGEAFDKWSAKTKRWW